MDFLRIRQKARERAREREESARAAASLPSPAAPLVPSPESPASVAPPPLPGGTLPLPSGEVGVNTALAAVAETPRPPPETIAPPVTIAPPETIAPPVTIAPPETIVPPETIAPPEAIMPPAAATPGGLAADDEQGQLEDALRVELTGVGAASPELAEDDLDDPLDEFFWREDETAPRLPDLVAASELPVPDPPAVRREWLTFRLGAEEYALEIEHVREVLKPPPLTEVPRAPADILGVIMVRGEVVAVIDPRARLGLPRAEPGPRARVLVCDTGEARCGVLVDAVSNVIRLAPASVEPRPPGVGGQAAEYIAGIGRDRNRLYVLLDARALLGDATGARATGVAP